MFVVNDKTSNLGLVSAETIAAYKLAHDIDDEEIETYLEASLYLAKSYVKELRDFAVQCAESYGMELDAFYGVADFDETDRLLSAPFWRLTEGSKVDWLTTAINKDLDFSGLNLESGVYTTPEILIGLASENLIIEYLESDSLTVFEAIALAGYAYDGESGLRNTIKEAVGIFLKSFFDGEITPRDPKTNIPVTKLHRKKEPDLSWRLTFEEAEKFALSKMGVSLAGLRDRLVERLKKREARKQVTTGNGNAGGELPPRWRKAFEYESEGLSALYELIEKYYFDANGNPIYDPERFPPQKRLESEWMNGRTLEEADRIITGRGRNNRKPK